MSYDFTLNKKKQQFDDIEADLSVRVIYIYIYFFINQK